MLTYSPWWFLCLAAAENEVVDSSDEDVAMAEEEPFPKPKPKRRRETTVEKKSPRKFVAPRPQVVERAADGGGYPPTLQWVPGHYMPSQPSVAATPWSQGPPQSYQPGWSGASVTEDSNDRGRRRRKRDAYEVEELERGQGVSKAAQLEVLPNGELDATCEGKTGWDEAVRNLVPKILDMSIVDWGKQKPAAVEKLRAALDNEFEYYPNPISMIGFRTTITRYMKSERSRLKTRWLKGNDSCPIRVKDDQWKRLKAYWGTEAQQKKAEKMSAARQCVANFSTVGRRSKAAKECQVVSRIP